MTNPQCCEKQTVISINSITHMMTLHLHTA